MWQDDFSRDEELAAKQQMLANAKKHLRDIQVKVSEFPLTQDIPLILKQNKHRLELEIIRLEKEIAAMSAPVEQQAQLQTQEHTADMARKRALATLTLEGDIGQFDEKEREAIIFALSRLLGVTTEEIEIKRVVDGSINIELDLPEETALQLDEMYLTNDPALQQLGVRVQGLEVDTYGDILIDILRNARAIARAVDLDRANLAIARASARALYLYRANRAIARPSTRASEYALASISDRVFYFSRTSDRATARELFAGIQLIAEAELGAEHPEVIAFRQAVAEFEAGL
jgi:hypothetical protein